MFEERVRDLQHQNMLVVLRRAGGVHAARVLDDLVKNYKVVDLALPSLRLQVEQDPERFVQGLQPQVYLANLHYAPRLLAALVASQRPLGQILASCSQSCYLQEKVGKVAFLELPLREAENNAAFVSTQEHLEELLTNEPHRDVQQEILAGSIAWRSKETVENMEQGSILHKALLQMNAQNSDRAALESYVHRVLQQDIMEQTTCSDDIKFYRFMCSVASITGTVINYTALANSVGITAPTARQWLRFLEGTGMIYLLQPLENVPGKRTVKAPKVYFRDTGVASFLLQIHDVSTLSQSVYLKRLFENYVVNLLRESYLERGLEPYWFFYRDSNAKEISLVLQHGQFIHPVAIDKDGLSAVKLRKGFAILENYAQANGLKMGCGCQIAAKEGSKKLGEGLFQLDAAVL